MRDALLAHRGEQHLELGVRSSRVEDAPSWRSTRACHAAGNRSAPRRTVMPAKRDSRLCVVSSATTRPAFSIAMRPHSASASSR